MRTTASWWSSFTAYAELSGVGDRARVWVPGPLTATMNLFAAVHARCSGAIVIEAPDTASHACLTPTTLDRLGERLPRGARVVVAGGPLSAEQHRRATASGLKVTSYYGAAELSFVAAGIHAGDLRPFAGVDVDVRDGEIWVHSPYLAEGLGPWATVGDRGRLDGERLIVHGRPGTVTTAGATVSLAEVESVLRSVAQAPIAVVGLPHDGLGEIVTAVVAEDEDLGRLRLAAREGLPATHRPRRWVHLSSLPQTAAGKVDHAAVRALALELTEEPS